MTKGRGGVGKLKRVILGDGLVASYAGKYCTLSDFLDPKSSNTPDLYHVVIDMKRLAGKRIRLIAEVLPADGTEAPQESKGGRG